MVLVKGKQENKNEVKMLQSDLESGFKIKEKRDETCGGEIKVSGERRGQWKHRYENDKWVLKLVMKTK